MSDDESGYSESYKSVATEPLSEVSDTDTAPSEADVRVRRSRRRRQPKSKDSTSKRYVRGATTILKQTADEQLSRYANGAVRTEGKADAKHVEKSSVKKRARTALWKALYSYVDKLDETTCQEHENVERTLVTATAAALSDGAASPKGKHIQSIVAAMREKLGEWMFDGGNAKGCKRSPREGAVWSQLNVCDALLDTYFRAKVRRCDMVWTRLLTPLLQQRLLYKTAGDSNTMEPILSQMLEWASKGSEGCSIMYVNIPSRSPRWYIGMTKSIRVHGSGLSEGLLLRSLEHATNVLGRNRDESSQSKYKLWRRLGLDAVRLVPVARELHATILNMESFWINYLQPPCQ